MVYMNKGLQCKELRRAQVLIESEKDDVCYFFFEHSKSDNLNIYYFFWMLAVRQKCCIFFFTHTFYGLS